MDTVHWALLISGISAIGGGVAGLKFWMDVGADRQKIADAERRAADAAATASVAIAKNELLAKEFSDYRERVARDYASFKALAESENRIATSVDRVNDNVDRLSARLDRFMGAARGGEMKKRPSATQNDLNVIMTSGLKAAEEIHVAMCLFDPEHAGQKHLRGALHSAMIAVEQCRQILERPMLRMVDEGVARE